MSWYALPSAQWFWEFLCALARNLVGTCRNIHHPQLVGSRFLRLWICVECLSIYVPISLCTDLSMYLCIHPSIHPQYLFDRSVHASRAKACLLEELCHLLPQASFLQEGLQFFELSTQLSNQLLQSPEDAILANALLQQPQLPMVGGKGLQEYCWWAGMSKPASSILKS